MLNEGQTCRDKYVDIAKGLAIIDVVCWHISSAIIPGSFVSFWPIVFFFLVAGFYIKEDEITKPAKFIVHKLKTLYIPATIIYLIAILMHNPLCRWGFYPLGSAHPKTNMDFVLWDSKTYLFNILKTIVAPNGELVMGAMWFLYALFFALCFLSVAACISSKIFKDRQRADILWFAIVVLTSTISVGLNVLYGFSIPRISQSLTAATFVLCGMLLKQRLRLNFNNWIIMIVAVAIYLQYIMLPHSHLSFHYKFPDIIFPLALGIAALYVILFISKKIERIPFLSDALSYVGCNSLYIMALHILGFFLCTRLLDTFGLSENLTMASSLYTYKIGKNFLLWMLYLAFGVFVPLIIIKIFRVAQALVVSKFSLQDFRNSQ